MLSRAFSTYRSHRIITQSASPPYYSFVKHNSNPVHLFCSSNHNLSRSQESEHDRSNVESEPPRLVLILGSFQMLSSGSLVTAIFI